MVLVRNVLEDFPTEVIIGLRTEKRVALTRQRGRRKKGIAYEKALNKRKHGTWRN